MKENINPGLGVASLRCIENIIVSAVKESRKDVKEKENLVEQDKGLLSYMLFCASTVIYNVFNIPGITLDWIVMKIKKGVRKHE